jgi:hypothetical protein
MRPGWRKVKSTKFVPRQNAKSDMRIVASTASVLTVRLLEEPKSIILNKIKQKCKNFDIQWK